MANATGDITRILGELNAGDRAAADRLLPLVYDKLRALAGSYFRGGSAANTLQPTALVHEAYIKLGGNESIQWESRAHFMAVAAKAMRQVLMNHARDKAVAKRGGGWQRITIDEAAAIGDAGEAADRELDLIALDDAMTRLASLSERQCHVVELRFFGGLTVAETAHVLGVGTTTVRDDWQLARVWLGRELEDSA